MIEGARPVFIQYERKQGEQRYGGQGLRVVVEISIIKDVKKVEYNGNLHGGRLIMVQIIMVDRNMVKVDLVGGKEIYSRGVTHRVFGGDYRRWYILKSVA